MKKRNLEPFKDDAKSLRKAEQFMLEMMKVPFAKLRLESMLFKLTFEERFRSLDEVSDF
jgi:hypothetical protein